MSGLSFLAPWSALVAAAVIPPLILLYFLKLKRREVPVSSTLLWKRAVEDLQVNSPFQRLRNNLLLILQLLILILAVLALTEPVWDRAKARQKLMILMIDQSASMNALEADGRTRLDHAKEAARRIVEAMGTGDQVMVIAFADRARTVASFSGDKSLLRRQIDSIEPTDGRTQLREALVLAEAYSTPIGENIGSAANPVTPAHVILISDGQIPDARDLVVRRGTMEIITVGRAAANVAIVNMDVRRNYEKPETVSVLVRVRNMGPEPVSRDLTFLIDGEIREVRELGTLAPNVGRGREPAEAGGAPDSAPEGSEVVVAFEATHPAAGRVEVRLSGSDALATDDRAYGTIDAPRPVSTLLVTRGNYFLKLALSSLPAQPPVILDPEAYENAKDEELVDQGRSRFDVVVFDGHDTDRLPPGNYLFFGSAPKIEGVRLGESIEGDIFVDWDDTHPVLRHVVVELIRVVRWRRLQMPKEAQTLIEGTHGPVLSWLARDRRQYLVCAFSLFNEDRSHLNTNWVMTEGFPAFMYNALQFLAGNVSAGGNRSVSPGSAVAIAGRPGRRTVSVRRPDMRTVTVPVRSDGIALFGDTQRAGFYVPEDAAQSDAAFAVNLFSDAESCVRPNESFQIGAEKVAATSGDRTVNRPLWPHVLLAALGVLFLEWILYNKRVLI